MRYNTAFTPPLGIFSQLLLFERAAAFKPSLGLTRFIYTSRCLCVCMVLSMSIHMYKYRYICDIIPPSPPPLDIFSQLLLFQRAAAFKPGLGLTRFIYASRCLCVCMVLSMSIHMYKYRYICDIIPPSPPPWHFFAAAAI